MTTSPGSNQPVRDLTLEKALSVANMVLTRSVSHQMNTESGGQSTPQTTNSSGVPMDNELFVPLADPLPIPHTQEEAQNPCTPVLEKPDPPQKTKILQKRKRQAPTKKPEPDPAKKKKAIVLKRGMAESDDLDFTETKPDAATMMDFPLPKINHGGNRPSRVPRHLYSTPPIPDLDDVNAVERAFRDLLSVREIVDWESRRLGYRLRLLKRKMSLEERREDARLAKLWEQEDGNLLEDIKRLEQENMKFDD
ncbi:uncharacterized protein N7496_000570 [Penicillium cataractarum]|uniref:Uncharacterized protein n=1 Tax=Penicillium cataractarum TaxID=2100454 RepID=A0A9W9VUA5_9EURO|nr:uncharacterized protein N7496_000570 [Penicillium cataractarum]KAJ5389502.1 hypothetical protein N7496_000570 [Penicillium cataractarum]